MSETKLSKEFAAGWIHFCDCIDFGHSALDADAIRFMNETPGKVVKTLKQTDDLLGAAKKTVLRLKYDSLPKAAFKAVGQLDMLRPLYAELEAEIAKAKK